MKKLIQSLTIILLVTTISSCLLVNSQATTDWWNTSWQYREQITITEQSGYTLEQFPLKITFEHSGHIMSNGDDIRVIDNNLETPYSIEKKDSTSATILISVDLTALATKSIYVYYGNPQAAAPNYQLVPLEISEGNVGHALIDNRIYIGWKNSPWGANSGYFIVGGNTVYLDNNDVTLWTDFKIDNSKDLLTDLDAWTGGIGRSHVDLGNFVERSYGLGDFQKYIQTPNFVDLVFADASLRVYKGQNFVETTQADRLQIESTFWDYACFQGSTEQNVIDGANTNGASNDPMWNTLYSSQNNQCWMAFRNSMDGYVLGAIGFNTDSAYSIRFAAKEVHAFDRHIFYDSTTSQEQSPYDQPSNCKIYWYADTSNSYSGIAETSAKLSYTPEISILQEQAEASPSVPEFPYWIAITSSILAGASGALLLRRKHN